MWTKSLQNGQPQVCGTSEAESVWRLSQGHCQGCKIWIPAVFLKKNIYSCSVYNFLFATIDNDPIRQNIYKLWERKGKCYEGLKRWSLHKLECESKANLMMCKKVRLGGKVLQTSAPLCQRDAGSWGKGEGQQDSRDSGSWFAIWWWSSTPWSSSSSQESIEQTWLRRACWRSWGRRWLRATLVKTMLQTRLLVKVHLLQTCPLWYGGDGSDGGDGWFTTTHQSNAATAKVLAPNARDVRKQDLVAKSLLPSQARCKRPPVRFLYWLWFLWSDQDK